MIDVLIRGLVTALCIANSPKYVFLCGFKLRKWMDGGLECWLLCILVYVSNSGNLKSKMKEERVSSFKKKRCRYRYLLGRISPRFLSALARP